MSDVKFERGKRQEVMVNTVPPDAPLFAGNPYLYACLKNQSFDGGKIIKGCTVRLGMYQAELQICITDEANGLYAYAVLDVFKPLSEALEEVLSSGAINWQDSRSKRK